MEKIGVAFIFILNFIATKLCKAYITNGDVEIIYLKNHAMISSQCEKIKIVSSLDTKFSSLEKSWYFIGVYIYNKQLLYVL